MFPPILCHETRLFINCEWFIEFSVDDGMINTGNGEYWSIHNTSDVDRIRFVTGKVYNTIHIFARNEQLQNAQGKLCNITYSTSHKPNNCAEMTGA